MKGQNSKKATKKPKAEVTVAKAEKTAEKKKLRKQARRIGK
jgi:hypothetical protein